MSVKRETLETLILVFPCFCLIPIGVFLFLFIYLFYVYGHVGSRASVYAIVCGEARVQLSIVLRNDGPIGIGCVY